MTFIFRNRTIFWDILKWNRGTEGEFFSPDEKQIKNREKCNVYNIFHNTFTTNAK